MQLFFEISGKEYRGAANWVDGEGLTAELNSLISGYKDTRIPDLPTLLLARVDEARTVLLIDPVVTKGGGITLGNEVPAYTKLTLRALAMVENLPWNFDPTTQVTTLRMSTTAMQLWRGDENLSISFDRKYSGAAQFSGTKKSRKVALGKMIIEQNLTLPYSAQMGSLSIQSATSVKILYSSPRALHECFFDLQAIEGYFDLLAAFPRRTATSGLIFAGSDRFCPIRVAFDQNEHTLDPNPDQKFMSYDLFKATGRTFDNYHKNFSEYRLFQATLRHLSRERVRLPEGFLTACNIIESLGKDAPSSRENMRCILEEIESALQGAPEMQNIFRKRIVGSIQLTSSFRDRYNYMENSLNGFGLELSLNSRDVVQARGRYRHEITRLNQNDITVMSSAIGVAWIYGLAWICRDIGISSRAVTDALRSTRFHLLRRTGLQSWGRIIET